MLSCSPNTIDGFGRRAVPFEFNGVVLFDQGCYGDVCQK